MFNLFHKKTEKGTNVDIREKYRVSSHTAYDGVPCVYYDIYLHDSNVKAGTIDLRLSAEGDMYYYGNIGYRIQPKFRGNHFAYEACQLLFKVAREEFNMDELIITCSPDNIASKKTLEKLGGTLVEKADVPKNHTLYCSGEKEKLIYRYRIKMN